MYSRHFGYASPTACHLSSHLHMAWTHSCLRDPTAIATAVCASGRSLATDIQTLPFGTGSGLPAVGAVAGISRVKRALIDQICQTAPVPKPPRSALFGISREWWALRWSFVGPMLLVGTGIRGGPACGWPAPYAGITICCSGRPVGGLAIKPTMHHTDCTRQQAHGPRDINGDREFEMKSHKPEEGEQIGSLLLPVAGSKDTIAVGESADRWTMLFVYRGRHCPRCKRFLNKLNDALPDWTDAMDVVVVSATPRKRRWRTRPNSAGPSTSAMI